MKVMTQFNIAQHLLLKKRMKGSRLVGAVLNVFSSSIQYDGRRR